MLVVVVVMMLVIVAAALAMLIVIVVMVMLVIVTFALAMLIVVVVMVMLVIVAAALAMLVVIVVMVVLVIVASALAMLVVIMVMMLVIVAAALAMLVVIVMMVVVMLLLESADSLVESILVLHCRENVGACKLIPGRCDYGGGGVILSYKSCSLLDSRLLCSIGMREYDCGSMADLIAEEFAKVLHIHLALTCVNDGSKASDLKVCSLNALHRLDNVGELTYARGLDKNSVRVVLCENLGKSLRKIAY